MQRNMNDYQLRAATIADAIRSVVTGLEIIGDEIAIQAISSPPITPALQSAITAAMGTAAKAGREILAVRVALAEFAEEERRRR